MPELGLIEDYLGAVNKNLGFTFFVITICAVTYSKQKWIESKWQKRLKKGLVFEQRKYRIDYTMAD